MSIYYVAGLPYSSELYHHGIKGQKWGVRRFQNSDGSLTPAGVKRYGTVENFQKAQQGKTKHGLSDATKRKLKTAAKVASVAALTGAAAYGAYKVGKGIQRDHENLVNMEQQNKILSAIKARDSVTNDVYDAYRYKLQNANHMFNHYGADAGRKALSNAESFRSLASYRIEKNFKESVDEINKETDKLRRGASFIKRISNAREWRRYIRNS